jgi:Spy/CpxP family protein refolding chaperone
MKRIILSSLTTIFLAGATMAQSNDQQTNGQRQEKKEWARQEGQMTKDQIMARLNLTNDQKVKLKEIIQKGKDRRAAINSNTELTQQQKNQQLDALREEGRQKVIAILTPEQQKEYKKMKAEAKKRYSRDKKAGSAGNPTKPDDVLLESDN